ncbi:YbaB/EbfC family nucleoid-associated protein [Candidatus Peregrinibacteria bacterium]|nr:MAG: YbaB/EbfC family nucleoid-associated protein [Candidatus Peregrinibacteria bacterium]
MFGQMKDMYQMQKKAKELKKKLKEIEIEAEEDGVLVVVNAAQDVVSVEFDDAILAPENKRRIEKNLKIALERAQKKAQEIAAEKMKPLMGNMGLPNA